MDRQYVCLFVNCSGVPDRSPAVDYMFERLIFTLDPDYFPKAKMREIVANLHSKNQHYSRLSLF